MKSLEALGSPTFGKKMNQQLKKLNLTIIQLWLEAVTLANGPEWSQAFSEIAKIPESMAKGIGSDWTISYLESKVKVWTIVHEFLTSALELGTLDLANGEDPYQTLECLEFLVWILPSYVKVKLDV